MRRSLPVFGLCLCLLLVCAAIPALADAPSSQNILLTIKVGTVGGSEATAKVYRTIANSGGKSTRIMAGQRIPIPVTTFQTPTPPSGEIVPITSYTYQNVGFEGEFIAAVLSDGKISLEGEIQDSSVSGTTSGGQPVIKANQQQFQAVFRRNYVVCAQNASRASDIALNRPVIYIISKPISH